MAITAAKPQAAARKVNDCFQFLTVGRVVSWSAGLLLKSSPKGSSISNRGLTAASRSHFVSPSLRKNLARMSSGVSTLTAGFPRKPAQLPALSVSHLLTNDGTERTSLHAYP